MSHTPWSPIATEMEEAFHRLLTAVPPEVRPVLRSAKEILSKSQLISENAHRHDIQAHVKLPDWDVYIGNDIWTETIIVYATAVEISHAYSSGWKWVAHLRQNGSFTRVSADTFPALFDQIVMAARP